MDLKWIAEIFRLGGWQIFALTLIAATIYFGPTIGISELDELPAWSKQVALVALIVCGALAITAVFQAATKPVTIALRFVDNRIRRRVERARIAFLLNRLSAGETEIPCYLVTANKQWLSVYGLDSNVNALFDKRLVRAATSFGTAEYSNYRVPDEVWEVLQARKKRFQLQSLPPAPPWGQPRIAAKRNHARHSMARASRAWEDSGRIRSPCFHTDDGDRSLTRVDVLGHVLNRSSLQW